MGVHRGRQFAPGYWLPNSSYPVVCTTGRDRSLAARCKFVALVLAPSGDVVLGYTNVTNRVHTAR